MAVVCAALMCHAPIVIPSIGLDRATECAETTRAMQEAARTLVAHRPDVIALVSPHSPRHRERWGVCGASSLHGSFARFGHGRVRVEQRGAPDAARTVSLLAAERGLGTRALEFDSLDHGALVPLYFLQEAGYDGGVLVIALPYPDAGSETAFGELIAAVARARNERWAILASGDMSHRLTPDAPAGYHPRARIFDDAFVARLRRGDLHGAIDLPRDLVEEAAEDVVQSTAVAAGAVGFATRGARVLAYEGPFGVGYCEALLYRETSEETPPEALVEVARNAIESALRERPYVAPTLAAPWNEPRPVFVTLRTREGELRGCIGRTLALTRTLAEEVADCAVGAATRDPRLPSVALEELPSLRIDVSVLRTPEPIKSTAELDPKRYGVVVSDGVRRGVLLPDIEGIESAEEQLRIALRKAGIAPNAPYRLERFTVDKVTHAN